MSYYSIKPIRGFLKCLEGKFDLQFFFLDEYFEELFKLKLKEGFVMDHCNLRISKFDHE